MSNRGRRDKMKNKEKREAPTLSKAMFTFGKISTHIYEESKREQKKMKLHTRTRTRKMR